MQKQTLLTIEYLCSGTPRQRAAYRTLTQAGIFEQLAEYHPVLAGTIPLEIDIPSSDLDILCEVYNFAPYAAALKNLYGHLPAFGQKTKELNGVISHISRFTIHASFNIAEFSDYSNVIEAPFPVEIVAQPIPTERQRAFLHLCAEARLLTLGGDPARAAIRALKRSGVKTESAFGQYFGLEGDPYQVLLTLGGRGDLELQKLFSRTGDSSANHVIG